jgi:hypothetical protein
METAMIQGPIRLFCALAAATIVIAAPAARESAQQPARDSFPSAPTAAAKGMLAGRVVAADTGQPLPGVRVMIAGGAQGSATTDAEGRFEFTGLPSASYTVSATRAGFVESTYGQQRPGSGRPGTPIQLADGQAIKDLSLRLAKGGVITGIIVDEFGYPATATPVRAYRAAFRNGERTLMQAASGQTDDRGQYRVYGLLPGEYVVVAAPRSSGISPLDAEKARLEVEFAAAQARASAVNELAKVMEARVATLEARLGASTSIPPDPPPPGYAPVYFPGTTIADQATRVSLDVSEEKAGVDIRLQLVPYSHIVGFVSGPSPLPAGLRVYLTEAGPVTAIGGRTAPVDAEGRFVFGAVPAGQYQLTARAALRPAVASVPSARGQFVEAAPAQWLWARGDLTLNGQPRADVSLTLSPGMSVAGTVAFRGTTQPASDATRVRLNFIPLGLGSGAAEMEMATGSARVDEQGRFTAVGLMPGRYRVVASAAGGWFLSSFEAQGREALDFPLEILPSQDVTGAVATFTDRGTTLSGTLQDATGKPTADYTVVVFAEDTRYWTPMSRRIQAVRPGTDGRFNVRSLPAGEYRLAAVVDPEPGQWFDPEFLRQLVGASTTLRLGAGESRTQDLRVGR